MPPSRLATTQNPWQRRLRRLFFFVGTASTFYFISLYILDRLKEARVKAVKERKHRDLMKNHFTSLTSTIHFTLYALLPTLQPQVFESYPVEQTSQAIQGLSSSSSLSNSVASVAEPEQQPQQPSLLLSDSHSISNDSSVEHDQAQPTQEGDLLAASSTLSTTESWASEFQRRDDESNNGSEAMMGQAEDDGLSSAFSQTISLPPTDMSSSSPSPPTSSMLHHSPPTSPPKSKKELWRDLKKQSLSRVLTTAYLLPMLYILTTSQLAVLARSKYLQDVKNSLPETADSRNIYTAEDNDGLRTPRRDRNEHKAPRQKGWFSSFSVESMGLTDFVEGSTSILPNPVALLPTQVTNYLPAFLVPTPTTVTTRTTEDIMEERRIQAFEEEVVRAEAERMFLTYSWWLLHEGWKSVAARVDAGVEKVFANLPLKKEMTFADWERIIKDIRAEVEMEVSSSSGTASLYNFVPHLIPRSQDSISSNLDLPFPIDPSTHSTYLSNLVEETLSHLHSPDGRYLLEKGVSAMTRNLLESVRMNLYNSRSESENGTRRLVDCLPEINKWARGIWEGIPDSGVEAVLAVPEFEGFAALIFGDWAPR